MESLTVQPISKASAQQRSGRAGREAPGFCYRLYTQAAYEGLSEETEPEIMRCNLASVVLMLKASGVDDVLGFDYMDKPSRTSIVRALEQLYALGALNDEGGLSELGQQMAELPLDPVYSKVLLQSVKYKCTKEVLTVIAMLSVDLIFFSPNDKREQAGQAKKRFMNYDGDHLTLLNVFSSFQTVHGDAAWCAENFISARSLKQVQDIRKQLVSFTSRQGIDTTVSCGTDNLEAVLKCFLSGCFQNVAMRTPDGSYKTLVGNQAVYIHPSSVLFLKKPDAVVYNELVTLTRVCSTHVSSFTHLFLLGIDAHDQAVHAEYLDHTTPMAVRRGAAILRKGRGSHHRLSEAHRSSRTNLIPVHTLFTPPPHIHV
ncbi:P-loop containing nucleoside triphosphate hydrolase protein [Powellomyces hirtus]|nr:P-loop containing nucleoside triphosphate hydrolase protein [Powellomyces hirtus]